MPRGHYRKATTVEIIKINDLLKKHLSPCEAVDPEGHPLFKYAVDWGDERVAKEIAPDITSNMVMHVRRDMYGQLIGNDKRDALAQRIDRIDARTRQLEEWIQYIASELAVKLPE